MTIESKKTKYKYVRIRNGIIYIHTYIGDKRVRVTTHLDATESNIKKVEKHHERFLNERFLKRNNVILKKTQNKKQEGILKSHNKKLFKNFAYESLYAGENMRNRRTTIEYIYVLDKHLIPYFGDIEVKKINAFMIKSWQNDMVLKSTVQTINAARKVLSIILKDALISEMIEKNPLALVPTLKADKKKIQPFSLEEIQKIIKGTKQDWFKNFLTLAFFTGMRTGEMMSLEWSDIDFDNNSISINKTMYKGILGKPKTESSKRVIDMLPLVKQALLRQYKITSFHKNVFLSPFNNKPFSYSTTLLITYWYPLLRSLDIQKRNIYQTRHTFASLMISRGEDVVWVGCKMMGHRDISMTLSNYTKYIEDNKKRATFLEGINIA